MSRRAGGGTLGTVAPVVRARLAGAVGQGTESGGSPDPSRTRRRYSAASDRDRGTTDAVQGREVLLTGLARVWRYLWVG